MLRKYDYCHGDDNKTQELLRKEYMTFLSCQFHKTVKKTVSKVNFDLKNLLDSLEFVVARY